MELLFPKTPEAFALSAAERIAVALREYTSDDRRVIVGLSGGSTPAPVYRLLASDTTIPWNQVTFFLLDERHVPSDHMESNTRLIRSTLLTHRAQNATFVFPNTALPLKECADDYNRKIQELLSQGTSAPSGPSEPSAPFVAILGMGPDGHIASLFPPLAPSAFGPQHVIHTVTDDFAIRDRISVTLPVLESAKQRLFLIADPRKRALLECMQGGNADPSLMPASALMDEKTTWIVGP
jgi:6-phosphogluconolactonase